MLLSYCRGCEYHEIIEKRGYKYSKCNKENCLSVYTKCLTEEAVRQFLLRDKEQGTVKSHPALEICYEAV